MRLLLFVAFIAATYAAHLNGFSLAAWYPGSYTGSGPAQSVSQLASMTNSNSMAIVWTWYQQNYQSTSIYLSSSRSPTSQDVINAATDAKSAGLQIIMKPHVDLDNDPSHWRGDIGTGFTSSQWSTWFKSYEVMINSSADLANQIGASIFVVGTELIQSEKQDSSWRHIVACIKQRAPNAKLVYGTNWYPGPSNIDWWDAVNYIGVDAYYPLTTSSATPSVQDCVNGWQSTLNQLRSISSSWGNKPILFTEAGYQSAQGCAQQPYGTYTGVYDANCQANAYTALLNVFYGESWFVGVLWWNWDPNPNYGGSGNLDYTPHGKPAEQVLKSRWPA